MDLLDLVREKIGNAKQKNCMGLFQSQRRQAPTVLLAWMFAPLASVRFWWTHRPALALGFVGLLLGKPIPTFPEAL